MADTCPIGADAAAASADMLMAIPISDLPHPGLLTVSVESVPPASDGSQYSGQATVELP
jgi:hypothetical protein